MLMGCEETKHPKIVGLCTNGVHRLISNNAVLPASLPATIDCLGKLVEAGIEELKVLQCALALVTNSTIVYGELLPKPIIICFRLKSSKDPTTAAIAAATLRQLVHAVLERVEREDGAGAAAPPVARRHTHAPPNLRQAASDAYLLFQDLCLLTNGDVPHWLLGVTEMSQSFGLELVETALTGSPNLFFRHPEFRFLLKEKVCALVIRMFSPSTARTTHGEQSQKAGRSLSFAVMIRLLRITKALIMQFYNLLATESEIFLSMLVRFLDNEKPVWQRVTSLEVLHSIICQPELIKAFCVHYDMQPSSTKVYRDLLVAIGTYVTAALQDGTHSERVVLGAPAVAGKAMFIEMLDKVDIPSITDTYGVSVAFACLLDCVKSMSSFITIPVPSAATAAVAAPPAPPPDLPIWLTMVESSWFGLLPALSQILQLSPAPTVTEPICKAFTSMIRVTGVLQMNEKRTAFVSVLCSACLPVGYSASTELTATKAQVSAKELQSSHAMLNAAICLGGVMGESWGKILDTIQLLVGLVDPPNPTTGTSHVQFPPAMGGRGGHARTGSGHKRTGSGAGMLQNAGQAAEVMAIGSLMSQLFASTTQLDDNSLQSLIHEACQLSEITLAQAAGSQSVNSGLFRNSAHLFMTVKILDVCLVNMDRIMVFWPLVTAHLIEISSHPNTELRDGGLEALTRLVVAALAHPRSPPIQESPGLQQAILSPLRNLSSCNTAVAYKRQLECVLQVMDTSGDSLKHAWPVVIGIINDAMTTMQPMPNATTIRIAFDSIRMVVTDFLPTVPLTCYPLLMDTISRFGQQNVDVNICLSAIGLLWNVSDFLSRHGAKMQNDLSAASQEQQQQQQAGSAPCVDVDEASLWMGLFDKLAQLCVDSRSEVRKSANQTLFSTITTHGNLLKPDTWQQFMATILFPLLANVDAAFKAAESAAPQPEQPGFMVHHSRNTAAKQWDETRVVTLGGVSKVFATFHDVLMKLATFPTMWNQLLEHIKKSSAEPSEEVSKAAILALQEVSRSTTTADLAVAAAAAAIAAGRDGGVAGAAVDAAAMLELWVSAWHVWLHIAKESAVRQPRPSLNYLTALVETFPFLYKHISASFTHHDATNMMAAVRAIADLQHHEALSSSTMTTVQDASIQAMLSLLPSESERTTPARAALVPMVLKELAIYASLGCGPPPPPEGSTRKPRAGACVPFSLTAMDKVSLLYTRYSDLPEVVSGQVALVILDVLKVPMARKYACPMLSLWRRSVHTFVSVVTAAVRGGNLHEALASRDDAVAKSANALCGQIVAVLDAALFTEVQQPAELSAEERESDAALDVELVHLIRDALLPAGADGSNGSRSNEGGADESSPQNVYYASLYGLLQRGTLNQLQPPPSDASGRAESPSRRSTFARESFQTLLDTALSASSGGGSSLDALLATSRNVLERHIEDDAANANLPPERAADAAFVLKAMSSVITPERKVLAVELYPLFVKCVACQSKAVKEPLQDLLRLYLSLF